MSSRHYLGADMRRTSNKDSDDKAKAKEEKIIPLDEEDIAILRKYTRAPYVNEIKRIEASIQQLVKHIDDTYGNKEVDTGLGPPSTWDLRADMETLHYDKPLLVGKITSMLDADGKQHKEPVATTTNADNNSASASGSSSSGSDSGAQAQAQTAVRNVNGCPVLPSRSYVVDFGVAKHLVTADTRVLHTDLTIGTRVACTPPGAHHGGDVKIMLPLPIRIDPSVALMQVEDKPDVTYEQIGGCDEQIKKLREIVELPLTHPERFVRLGVSPPKGALLYGPPGTGKTLCARAVANTTQSAFIRVIGSELVRKYVGEGGRIVRELFACARAKRSCIVFIDEVDAIGGRRAGASGTGDSGDSAESDNQRTMLELVNQLDGFDARGNIKVLMATNRSDTLDPALVRPGRIDRSVQFALPDIAGRQKILSIHASQMSSDRSIRFALLARLCPNCTGADLRSVCTEAGMFAIRARRKMATEADFLKAIEKVVKGYAKFNATPHYLTHN